MRGLPLAFLVSLAMLAVAPSVAAHNAAHNATVKASATCVEGHYVIDWTALSWVATDGTTDSGGSAAPWRGLNQKPGITIGYRIGWHGHFVRVPGVHTLTAAETTGVVVDGTTHQFPSATGSFTLPGNAKGQLVLRLKAGPWGPNPANGRYAHHGWQARYFAIVRLNGDCGGSDPTPPAPPPAVPGASAAAACVGTAAVVRVGLTNAGASGADAFAFTVSSPATGSKPVFGQTASVAAGGSASVDVPVDENGSRTITASGSGFSQSFTATGDCVADPQPNASAAQVCTNGVGAIRITLTNTNGSSGESIAFSLSSPATGSQPAYAMSITLNGGDTRNLDVPVDEDTARTVTVTAPGMATATFTRTIDCDSPAQPQASAYSFCDGPVGTIVITLTNRNTVGSASVAFAVDLPAVGTQPAVHDTVTVAGGSSQEIQLLVDEGTIRTGSINAPGMTTLNFSFGADCI